MQKNMKYLFWDIDGTLLLTGKAGIKALKLTVKERFNKDDFEFGESMAGRTDSYIIKKIVQNYKEKYTAADAASFLITYNQLLRKTLKTSNGTLLPNVKENLEFLETQKDKYTSLILTGNCRPAAIEKVKYYQIENFFNYSLSVFGEISEEREMLSKAAYQKIFLRNPNVNPDDIIIIGDTPYDIQCAHAIGARSIAVLAGNFYSKSDIEKHNPWQIIDKLPENPKDLLSLIEG